MSTLQTFKLTPAQLKACADRIKAEHGIDIDPTQPSGTVTSHGVTLKWTYDGATLGVSCVNKPWVVSMSTVVNGINDFFKV